jgi:hypothetical protein
VKGQRPQDGPRAPSGARPSSSPRDPLPPIHSRTSSCSRKLRNHIRLTWLLFMAQTAPVRRLHLWRHRSRKFYSHACAPQVTRTSYTTEKIYFFFFFFFTLLPTWAVCEIPSSYRTLCRHSARMACHYDHRHSLSTHHASNVPPLQECMGSRDELKSSVISTRGDTYLSSI